jgi:uncharacterized protein (DUF1015 family)
MTRLEKIKWLSLINYIRLFTKAKTERITALSKLKNELPKYLKSTKNENKKTNNNASKSGKI